MNITHEYIRGIVGEEPQEWWPTSMGYLIDAYVDNEEDCSWVSPDTAYHAFVGAAVEWLGKHHKGTFTVDVNEGYGAIIDLHLFDEDVPVSHGPCLLSALVRAIGEVK